MDMLTSHGISWVNYRPSGRDSEFRSYLRYRRRRSRHHLSSLGRPLRKTSDVFKCDLQFTSAIYPLGLAGYMTHVRSIEKFFADAAAAAPLGALDLAASPKFLTPPELPEPALAWGTW
jgi:hypothetical protein